MREWIEWNWNRMKLKSNEENTKDGRWVAISTAYLWNKNIFSLNKLSHCLVADLFTNENKPKYMLNFNLE